MQTLTRTLIETVAAGVMAASAATPALAHDDYGGRYDGRHDLEYGRYGHRGVNADGAVQQCVAAATRAATRYSYGSRARVTGIRGVDHKRYGYKVEGRIAVNTMHGHWRYRAGGYDSGRFVCKVDYRGRIAGLDFTGIRGL